MRGTHNFCWALPLPAHILTTTNQTTLPPPQKTTTVQPRLHHRAHRRGRVHPRPARLRREVQLRAPPGPSVRRRLCKYICVYVSTRHVHTSNHRGVVLSCAFVCAWTTRPHLNPPTNNPPTQPQTGHHHHPRAAAHRPAAPRALCDGGAGHFGAPGGLPAQRLPVPGGRGRGAHAAPEGGWVGLVLWVGDQ